MQAILPSTMERVEEHTSPVVNHKIMEKTALNIENYKTKNVEEIKTRLRQLDREWDTERTLETSAASLVMIGTLMGALANRKWHWLSGAVGAFLLQHALQGWCPPLSVIRRLGVRTPTEIFKERTALIQILEQQK